MQDASGYLYRRNRYYDPKTGRFTQEDPIGLAGGMNAYGYAEGDPVSYSDPFGLCPPQDSNNGPWCSSPLHWILTHVGVSHATADRWSQTLYRGALTAGAPGNGMAVRGVAGALGRAAAAEEAQATIGSQIGAGHAWTKHGSEFAKFGIKSSGDLGRFTDEVMATAKGADVRQLARGRTAYWDSRTSSVVIRDPNNIDGGTVFVPREGRAYFDGLK
jgi:uncharacterized protein RhaS with RHS repeats